MDASGHRRVSSLSASLPQVLYGRPSENASADHVLNDPEGTPVLDFYQKLHLAALSEAVTLTIPETVIVSGDGRDIVLFSDDDNRITVIDSDDVLNRFFDLCAPKLQRDAELSEFPLFIFSTSVSSYKVLFSVPDAEKQWKTSKDQTKLLQRYLIPCFKKPMKTRIIWTPAKVRRFNIKKRGLENLFQDTKKVPVLVKHGSFSSVVKVRKSSFSPYLPYESHFGAHRRDSDASPITETITEPYFVSSRREGDSIVEEVNFTIPQTEDFAATILEVMHQCLVSEDHVLTGISYDVIQELNGKLHFLNVKWVKCGPIVDLSPVQISSDTETRLKDVRRRFTELLSTDTSSKTPFIDMHDIQEQNVRLYMHQFPNLHSPTGCPINLTAPIDAQSQIEQAGTKLDTLVQAAMSNKIKNEEDHRVKLESYPKAHFLDFIISKVYSKVICDPVLGDFFMHMDGRRIHILKIAFSKAFTGVDNYYFKRTIKIAHQGLGITEAQFARFVEQFVICMREEGVRNEDAEIVYRHLMQFSDEVVEY